MAARARLVLLVPAFLLLVASSPGCGRQEPVGAVADAGAPAAFDVDAHRREIEEWRARRLERLRDEEGWLTLAGLFWLQPGANGVGTDPGARVVLPEGKAPARLGTIVVEGEAARFESEPGAAVVHAGEPVTSLTVASDAEGEPTRLETGDLVFYLIRRGERLGVRVKDRQSPVRLAFEGIDSYPIDPRWRLVARFEEHDPPRTLPVPNILGTVNDSPSWGTVVFEHAGRSYRLDAIAEPGDEQLFLIFADETSGRETYGGGRYLYADAPAADGSVVVDFNKAYNPPCVFTPYATCPLPPRGNRLALRIEAGEKRWGEAQGAH